MTNLKKKNAYIVLFIAMIPGFILIGRNFIKKNELRSNGVFVIGKLIKIEKAGFRGGVRYYSYSFHNVNYIASVMATSFNDSLAFINVLPYKAEVAFVEYEHSVPPCLTLKDVPYNGWKEIPSCK